MTRLSKFTSIFKSNIRDNRRQNIKCVAYPKSKVHKIYDKIKREKHLKFYDDIIEYKYRETLKVCDPYLEMKKQKDCEILWNELVMLNKLKYSLIEELKDNEFN